IILLLFALVPAAHAQQDASIVSIAVTPTGDGVLVVPVNGDAAFSLAMVNVGPVTTQLLVEAGQASYPNGPGSPPPFPLTVRLCRTNPTTGQCLAPQELTGFPVGLNAAPGEVHTFSVFVHASDVVPFLPNRVRVAVTFRGRCFCGLPFGPGAEYSSTTVA